MAKILAKARFFQLVNRAQKGLKPKSDADTKKANAALTKLGEHGIQPEDALDATDLNVAYAEYVSG